MTRNLDAEQPKGRFREQVKLFNPPKPMPIRRKTTEDASINLTPMIDVVFLLVIFFMVGSEFSEQRAELRSTYRTLAKCKLSPGSPMNAS